MFEIEANWNTVLAFIFQGQVLFVHLIHVTGICLVKPVLLSGKNVLPYEQEGGYPTGMLKISGCMFFTV